MANNWNGTVNTRELDQWEVQDWYNWYSSSTGERASGEGTGLL